MDATLHRSAELNRARRLGVEHEFAIPLVGSGDRTHVQQLIARILTDNGLPAIARPYCHEPIPARYAFAVEYDASVTGESQYAGITWVPIEVKTRPLSGYDEWESVVPKMLQIVSYLGGRATKSCGYHVHLELTEFLSRPTVVRSLFNLFHRFEPVIYKLVPPSRHDCGYCRPLTDRSGLLNTCKTAHCFRRALAGAGTRYSGLNLTHVFADSGPRIELRYGGGTLDPAKARHWLRLCLQLTQHACNRTCQAGERVAGDRKGLDNLFVSCGFKVNSRIYQSVSDELRETAKYLLLHRWRRFAGRSTQDAADDAGRLAEGAVA